MKKIALIGNAFLFFLYFLVIILGLAVVILLVCGMKLYCVETGSLEPEYRIGSVVVVQRVYFENLSVGDVITYSVSDNKVVTHRVVGIDNEQKLLRTKGDNNDIEDSKPVPYNNVVGKVIFKIPAFGYVILFLSTRFGRILLVIIALGLIGIYFIRKIYRRMSDAELLEDNNLSDANNDEKDNDTELGRTKNEEIKR